MLGDNPQPFFATKPGETWKKAEIIRSLKVRNLARDSEATIWNLNFFKVSYLSIL